MTMAHVPAILVLLATFFAAAIAEETSVEDALGADDACLSTDEGCSLELRQLRGELKSHGVKNLLARDPEPTSANCDILMEEFSKCTEGAEPCTDNCLATFSQMGQVCSGMAATMGGQSYTSEMVNMHVTQVGEIIKSCTADEQGSTKPTSANCDYLMEEFSKCTEGAEPCTDNCLAIFSQMGQVCYGMAATMGGQSYTSEMVNALATQAGENIKLCTADEQGGTESA